MKFCNKEEDTHAPASPSAGGIWVNCPGFLNLKPQCELLPPSDKYEESSNLGTAAHHFASWMLMKRDENWVPAFGDKAPNGVLFDEEMFFAVVEYVNHCKKHLVSGIFPVIEQMIGPSDLFGSHCFGTPDVYFIDHANKRVWLRDYKHGFGLVEAFENWQQIIYAGILSESLDNDLYQYEMGIVQPRGFHPEGTIREWSTTEVILQPMWDKVKAALDEAYGKDAPAGCKTGSWCRRCPVRLSCTTHAKEVGEAMDYAERGDPIQMTTDDKAIQLLLLQRMQKTMDGRIDALEEDLKHQHSVKGETSTYLTYDLGKGRTRWKENVTAQMIKSVGESMKIDLVKPLQAVTPTQAKALGADHAVIDSLAETPSSGIKLKPAESHKARRIFSQKGK